MEEQNHIWSLITKKLSGEATFEQRQELEAFLKAHPEQQYTVEMLADWWNHQAAERQHEGRNLDFARLKAQLTVAAEPAPAEVRRSRYQRWSKGVVAVVVLLLISSGTYFYIQKNRKAASTNPSGILSQISTSYGSKSQVILPDGSRIWLNAGSNLSYNNATFGITNRKVTLTGEAYFNVVGNPHFPFVVHAGQIKLTVLGTAFDLKSYPEDPTTQATLIQGAIEVAFNGRSNQAIRLKPLQTLTVFKSPPSHDHPTARPDAPTGTQNYHIAPLTHLPDDTTIVETSWVENKLAFRNERFDLLARKMERWYNVHMTFTDPEVKKYRFSGAFINESLEQALQRLRVDSPFAYRIKGDEVYLTKTGLR